MVQINKNMHCIHNFFPILVLKFLQAPLELFQDKNKWINIPYLWNYLNTSFSGTRVLTPY